ncbi:MAG: insulinase family protein, partial [Luteolibacter sp.]
LFDEIEHADLTAYHRARYTPDKTHLVISGDFDAAKASSLVEEMTAACRIVTGPEPHLQSDPPQIGAREGFDTFDIPTSRLCLSWKTPAIDHPDAPAYDLLAAILGRGKSSRLHRILRDQRQLALEISAWTWIDPGCEGLIAISAETAPEKRDELKEAILREIAELSASALDEDLAKAKRQTAASQFRTLTTASGRASDLASNWHEARDLDFTRHYLAAINTVTPADIRRVAQTLTPRLLTYTSLDPEDFTPIVARKKAAATRQGILTRTLSNGLHIALLPDHRVPLIHFQAAARAGLVSETAENNGLNQLFASTLTKGTLTRSAVEIATALESLGANISAATGNNALMVQAAGLSADILPILDIFADVILNPSFPSDAIAREKASQLASLEEALTDPLHRCFSQLRATHYSGKGYGLDSLGTVETLEKLERIDLAAHHSQHFCAANLTLAVSGDFDPEAMADLIESHFKKLPLGHAWTPPASSVSDGQVATTTLPKKQAVLAIGYPGTHVGGKERHALAFINEHSSDMAGPLFGRIREELGLAYRVGATQFLGYDQGMFTFYLATSPEQIDLARTELEKEIAKIAAEGIPKGTFERVRSTVLSGAALQQQSISSNARHAALDLLFGHPAETHRLLPEIYASLTPENVREVAKTIFAAKPTVSVILGEKA